MVFYHSISKFVWDKAKKCKLLALDVDGVLTDGKVYYNGSSADSKPFFVRDGLGLVLLQQQGIQIAVISGRADPGVDKRVKELQINYYYPGVKDKLAVWDELLERAKLKASECAYIGDDLIDLPILVRVGFAVTVQNAHPCVTNYCHYTTHSQGGAGAVREVCDIILYAQDKFESVIDSFLS
ncbi:MAG: HAD-IIIA family hydrolase [Neisseriaceae bacterium]